MSNPFYYKNISGNNFTFQNNFRPPNFPPPPLPPPIFLPPVQELTPGFYDQEFVKKFEVSTPLNEKTAKPKSITITEVKEKLCNLVVTLNDVKDKEKMLLENVNVLSEADWNANLDDIEKNKARINESMSNINDAYLDLFRKLLAKRSAKRLRLKRLRQEKKREKEEKVKEMEEQSRKIDENLQKIKDEIIKAKQEEESKIQADIVLKEVLRKKHDAKKCIIKLDALIKLRKARQNTARGRGESVSERDADAFDNNIEKLKALWIQKQAIYDKEETELRAKLKRDTSDPDTASKEKEKRTVSNLAKWREVLFGISDATPQADFRGDIGRFVAVRSQWDRFVSSEGTPLPVGWVLPQLKNQ